MNTLSPWIHTSLAQALGWALVHFVWEGAALAILLMAMLAVFRRESAQRRYALACLVLAAMPLAFAVTLALLWVRRPIAVPVPIHWVVATATAASSDIPAPRFSWRGILDRLPWLVPLWSAGVAFFWLRGLAGWVAVRRLRRRGVCAPPAQWQTRVEEVAARLRISRPVVLLESCIADAPVLIGYLRPVILLPLGCLTGLSTAQVECILVHELAHVARHDYLVNLLQSMVEGLLFYHPAVWWVSRVVRAERENCCDDRVVELVGNVRVYAATLAVLEERRAFTPQAALAANGGNLMKRIRRLTESRTVQPSVAPAFSAAVLLVLFAAGLSALPAKLPKVRRAAVPTRIAMAAQVATPYEKWLTEDVAYIISDRERADFRALTTDAQRESFITQFWETRPADMKMEHYRRIAYVNEHFAGTVAGWKTDRGRTYVVYGPPDEIDDHAAGGDTPYAFQKWQYRYIEGVGENVVLEFVDRARTGDFPLTVDGHGAVKAPYRAWINEDVAYIVTEAERAAFQALTSDTERETYIEQFWQRRQPEMRDEHYRRIAYANQHFQSGIPGWKTDRGRVYISYGPPDEIHEAPGKLEWKYRYIEGVGNNVSTVFEDPQGKGDYRLIKEPRPAQATVFASKEPAAVSVIVSHDPMGAPGIIGIGDMLHVDYTATASDESRIEAVASRQEQERPIRAELYTSMEKLRHLNSEWEQRSKELHDVRELSAEAPTRVRELNQLSEEFNGARGRYWQLVEKNKDKEKDKEKDKNKDKSKDKNKDKSKDKDKEKDELELQQAEQEMEARQQQLAVFRAQNQLLMPETLAPKVQAMTAAVAELDRAKDNEKMRIAVLEKNLNQLPEKNPFPPPIRHVSAEIIVGTDGAIRLDSNLAFTAAGRTPAQLEAAIGAGATVRVLSSPARMVIVLVPVGQGRDPVHVYGEIRAGRQNKIAQTFEEAVAGRPAVAKTVPLRAGSYHLSVVWKNMTSGATHNSDLDFTVD